MTAGNKNIPRCTPRDARRLKSRLSTFEEERQEVLDAVLESLVTEALDPGRTAACLSLLRHLARVASQR